MGTGVYNNLPKSLKEINDYKVFKKVFLFSRRVYIHLKMFLLFVLMYTLCCIDIYILLICTVNNVYMLRM